jgi:hypothetical protein
MSKFAAKYVIDIYYPDGSCDRIVVGKNIFSLCSCRGVTGYWLGGKLFSLIEKAAEKEKGSTEAGSD